MNTDATQQSVSSEAENKEVQQNAEVSHVEVEVGADAKNNNPVNSTDKIQLESENDSSDKEPQLTPREIKMAQISENRKKTQEKGTQPEFSNEDLGLPDDYNEQGGVVTLDVSGEKKEVSAEKVMEAGIRTLQKESAADKKLESAVDKEKAVNKRMDELSIREQNILKREQEIEASKVGNAGDQMPSAPADVSKQSEFTDDEADQIVDDFYSGDKDKARDAVKKLGAQPASQADEVPPVVTAEDVANVVERRSAANKSLETFSKTYPGIAEDENLQNIVNNESLRIARDHPEYDTHKLLMESGKYVAKNYGSVVVDDSGFSEKAARKADTDTVTGADATRMPEAEKPPQTRSQAVSDLKKNRR